MDRLIKNHGSTTNEIGVNNKLTKEEKNKLIQDLIKKLFSKVDNKLEQQQKTYTIDRFEYPYAVCENRDTLEMINIELSQLPSNIQEGDIVIYKNDMYIIDEIQREEIEQRINEKIKNIFED